MMLQIQRFEWFVVLLTRMTGPDITKRPPGGMFKAFAGPMLSTHPLERCLNELKGRDLDAQVLTVIEDRMKRRNWFAHRFLIDIGHHLNDPTQRYCFARQALAGPLAARACAPGGEKFRKTTAPASLRRSAA